MHHSESASKVSPETLLEIVRTQTEITKLGLDLGAVIACVAERVRHLTRATGAVVELAEGEDMVYRAVSGDLEQQLGLRLRRQGSLSGLCVATGQILRCEDSETDERVDRQACRRVGLRSMIVMPLNHAGATVGVLKVTSPAIAAFGEDDLFVLGLMSEQIAAAMFHATRWNARDLYHQATHDPLTGLANRALFFDRLRHCLLQAGRRSERVGLVNLDMDNLKPINDRYGHRAGDAAIREVGARLASVSRQSDTVARVGGDEFGVILSRIDSREGARSHAGRIGERLSAPFSFEDQPVDLAASIGIAVFPDDGREVEALADAADRLMYDAKRARKADRGVAAARSAAG